MKTTSKLMTLALAACLISAPALAQNPFDMAKKAVGGNTNSAAKSANIYASFLASRLEMNNAQLELAQAFDLKDQITLLQAEQTRLQSGAIDADGIKKSTTLSNSVSEAINDKITQKASLSDEGRKHFTNAMPHLALGTLATVKLVAASKDALSNGSMAEKISLGLIAKDMPGLAKTTYDNYKMVLTYGKENKIPMPANASDALGSL